MIGRDFFLHIVKHAVQTNMFSIFEFCSDQWVLTLSLFQLVEMTFNVWYRISEGLFMIDDDNHLALFKPYVNRLVLVVSGSLPLPLFIPLLKTRSNWGELNQSHQIWTNTDCGLGLIFEDSNEFPMFSRYLMALYRHSRYDTDETSLPDPNSDFAEFRLKVHLIRLFFIDDELNWRWTTIIS